MSITGAMNAAISGLRAAALGSELVSNNISNALTPSYGRRGIDLSALNYGATGGVRVDGIARHMDEGVAADRRLADASFQQAKTSVDFYKRLENVVGLAGDTDALTGRLANFEQSLITAASRPDVAERLTVAVSDAKWLVTGIGDTARAIQELRTQADSQIDQDVRALNTALEQVEQLNIQITSAISRSGGSPALLDQRQVVLDTIGSIVPINAVPRDNGAVAIYTEGGAILLDVTAAELGFTKQNLVTEFQSIAAGTLSGLTLNGQNVRISALAGGSLGAQFDVRDRFAVDAQAQVDALARDLIDRFGDASIDTSRAPGDPGLFTDSGLAFNTANELGLSNRIALNTAVDPAAGGEVWRLRDGLGAATQGPSGNAALLNDLRSAMDSPRATASAIFGGVARSTAGLFATFSGTLATDRSGIEQKMTFSSARLSELTQLQLRGGVDTDQELQNLLVLEQAYAANARVIQAADNMLETLTRL